MPVRALLVWSCVAISAAWVVVRAFGLERGYPMVPLLAYTPLAAVAALALALGAALLRERAAAAAALVLGLVLAGFVAPRALGGASGAEGGSGPALRVLTANLHQEPATAEGLVALARSTRADVLSVQELTPEVERALAAAGLAEVLPERVVEPREGSIGAGLYARVPLRRLPGAGPSAPAAARVRVGDAAPFELYAVHPTAPRGRASMAAWRDGLRALPPATRDGAVRVLAGDFNATLDNAELRRVVDRGYEDAAAETGAGLRATWPSGRRFPPPVTIDHVLADTRAGWREVRVYPVPHSDHRAVLAEVVAAGPPLERRRQRERVDGRGAAAAQLAGDHRQRPAAEADVVDEQARARGRRRRRPRTRRGRWRPAARSWPSRAAAAGPRRARPAGANGSSSALGERGARSRVTGSPGRREGTAATQPRRDAPTRARGRPPPHQLVGEAARRAGPPGRAGPSRRRPAARARGPPPRGRPRASLRIAPSGSGAIFLTSSTSGRERSSTAASRTSRGSSAPAKRGAGAGRAAPAVLGRAGRRAPRAARASGSARRRRSAAIAACSRRRSAVMRA